MFANYIEFQMNSPNPANKGSSIRAFFHSVCKAEFKGKCFSAPESGTPFHEVAAKTVKVVFL